MAKTLLTWALALVCGLSQAAAFDPVLNLRNQFDAGNDQFIPSADHTQPLIWLYDFTKTPKVGFLTIGTGLAVSGTSLISTFTPPTWASISGRPAWTNTFDGSFASLSAKPTTLAGYGITDGATSAALTAGLATKFNTPTGTTAQYLRGDGSLAASVFGTVTSVTAGTGLSGGVITSTGTISLPNVGTAGSYSDVTTDAQGRVTAGTVRAFSYPTRALNTCFQVSATRDALASYGIEISTTSTLIQGGVGTVFLETFTNSACTTGTQEIGRATNGNTQTLGITVTMTQTFGMSMPATIPAGVWVKLRTSNVAGTPTFTARPGQEVLL